MSSPVCVIIPAFNAEATIGRAIASALAQPEVGEIFVVDDCSTDATAATAIRAGEGSSRLKLVRLEQNRGPSAARNQAIASSRSPLIAILDADDFLLKGRFAPLLAREDWDLVADNILFLPPALAETAVPPAPVATARWKPLGLGAFIAGNIAKPGKPRGELGFLKPVMRRSMLEQFGLRYDESVRLGEDYLLYANALARGARFSLYEGCGYVAIERPDSLSGKHATDDLARLLEGDEQLLRALPADGEAASLAARHWRSVRSKYDHRRFLDDKASLGLVSALAPLLARPGALAGVGRAILRDKTRSRASDVQGVARLLLAPRDFDSAASGPGSGLVR